MLKLSSKLLVILLVIILGTFSFPNKGIFKVAKATYVEGLITSDTIWTVVDSPFIVSNDVTVSSNATLIVEPGVEVRFGGAFSLIVLGKLYADGTDKTIEFTSNRQQPDVGDWKAVEFRGPGQSTLEGCSVTYATDGIFIDNGDVTIENGNISLCSKDGVSVEDGKLRIQGSTISYCSQNGIDASNSELTIQDNLITDNNGNGINMTGDRPVTIQGNTIISNRNGISLTGNETANVEIIQNVISTNEQNGIEINTDSHANLDITHNNLSSNQRGFYISSPTETRITNNSISYNHIGILYGEGSHTIHFNDIYGNDLGMDSEEEATANAEQNYWGHESGPYHEILNPRGRGNPVGGNGLDLDFVFFLTEPFGHINARPNATLLTDKALVPPSETILFFGTNSLDEGRVDRYSLDFGDGNVSGWTTLSTFTHQYSSTGNYSAKLTVMDDFGITSVNDATVTIEVVDAQDFPPLLVNMDVSEHLVYEGEQISVTVHVANDTTSLENAYVALFSLKSGVFTDTSGYTNSTGYFTTTFTAPDVIYMANVRIVATVSKTGYTDGSDYEDLQSVPALTVQVVSDAYLRTEKTGQVTVIAESNGQPVDGATVSLSATYGDLSDTVGITDSDGLFSTFFTAPQTTESLDVAVMATARKNGYLDGAGQTVITVEPKVLVVRATAEPTVVISEAAVNLSVHVEYEMVPVSGANVTITSESFNATELTDLGGDVRFTFAAPPVDVPSNVTLSVKGRKDGYADGETQLRITVNPGELDVHIEVGQSIVDSGKSTIVTVNVTCNGAPVEGASIEMSSTDGIFLDPANTTNSDGYYEFDFRAPRTTIQLTATVVANATKDGYIGDVNQTTIMVAPEVTETGGGWPLTTILLILIPAVIAVVVVVLVKLGVISFSTKEEEG